MATSARTTRAKSTDKTTDAPPVFQPRQSAVTSFRASKVTEPNPLAGVVEASRDNPQAIDVTGEAQAKEVVGYLRRDANESGSGVRILCTDDNGKKATGDAITTVHFVYKERSKRQYTTADIKTWYEKTYGSPLSGKVTKEIRDEFRKANGYDKTAAE